MKSGSKKTKLLAQYTQKKLLNEEKKYLLEKLTKDCKERREIITKYEKRNNGTSEALPRFRSKRREKEKLYEQALVKDVSTNEQSIFVYPYLKSDKLVSSSEDDDWEGFLEPPQIQVKLEHNEAPHVVPRIDVKEDIDFINQDFTSGKSPIMGTSIYRLFNRSEEIERTRELLPILAGEQTIIEMVKYNDISFICGETGSGKTTQLPQFLLEAGFSHPESSQFKGKIIITQPRRVAATSMASRVALELGSSYENPTETGKSLVGYQVRYDSSTIGPATRIIFMTDGILLKIIANDFLLSSYSVIVLDEAHERNINTDLLLGLLTRIVYLRRKKYENGTLRSFGPLKLVIMSATLQISELIENPRLFPAKPLPPSVNIASRQYPINVHFSRITPTDFLSAAFKKIIQIHKNLPAGGILVFVTGQDEVWSLINRLLGKNKDLLMRNSKVLSIGDIDFNATEHDIFSTDLLEEENRSAELLEERRDYNENYEGDFEDSIDSEIVALENLAPMKILPFYSLLKPGEQEKVLQAVCKPNERLVIISTNLAETSITIPGISYVVDTGRVKKRIFTNAGIENFHTTWISKASASQRAGRAGRIGPGHVYRLYSSALYEDLFEEFDPPEILTVPAENMVLQMKSMNIDNVLGFPFPTTPDKLKLEQAERLLSLLGSISYSITETWKITDAGKGMSVFPLPVRLSKMIVETFKFSSISILLPLILDLVSALSIDHFFTSSRDTSNLESKSLLWDSFSNLLHRLELQSDLFVYLHLFQSFSSLSMKSEQHEYCSRYCLNEKGLSDAIRLRTQLESLTAHSFKFPVEMNLKHQGRPFLLNSDCISLCPQIVSIFISAHPDCFARRISSPEKRLNFVPVAISSNPTLTTSSPIDNWISLLESKDEDGFNVVRTAKPNRSSVFSHISGRNLSEFVVYGGIQQHCTNGTNNENHFEKLSLSVLSEVKDISQIPEHCRSLLKNQHHKYSR